MHFGLYFPYDVTDFHLTTNLQYYAKEPTCDYQWKSSSHGRRVENAIQIKSNSYTYYVGRIYAFNSYHVGKVTLEHKTIYYGYNGKTKSSATYEVLVCNPVTTTTPTPTTSLRVSTRSRVFSDDVVLLNVLNTELTDALKAKTEENVNLIEQNETLEKTLQTKMNKISELQEKLNQCLANKY